MTRVFIVGAEGTAGLRLHARLQKRADIALLEIDPALRKERRELRRLIDGADFVFLCLPDAAALEIAALAQDSGTRIIDTSTAHRTAPGWAYGFPELSARHRNALAQAKRAVSPGCHASGFIALVYPLISLGMLSADSLLTCSSLTGYSGGGKKMIAAYEAARRPEALKSPLLYALDQTHKHLPEISAQCGLTNPPVFMPVVGDFYSGMLVSVPLHAAQLKAGCTAADIHRALKAHYAGSRLVRVSEEVPASLSAGAFAGRDDMVLFVSGGPERIVLSALFDNLGKGASGAAIQCFNLMLGLPEETGLALG
ncbi:MAG: N-acetyl-gamma-glutamyl-phosphate reductase [Oscillospiraceae bacterium]|nr:N-acetyl-gamma-glutamyl-phosphate reductase [Oscillospiraceae bacterium]